MDNNAKSGLELNGQIAPGSGKVPDLAAPGRKLVLLGLGVATLLALVYFSPLRDYLGRLREVSDRVRASGPFAPLLVTGGVAALVAIGFPRLFLCVIAGMALGFWSGLLWAQLGTLVGNYVVFLTVRFGARDWADRYVSKHGKLQSWLRTDGIKGVILARQVPVPGLLINLACGLLPLRQRHFLIGTLIGQLPEAIPSTLFGAGILQLSPKKSAAAIGAAVACAVLVWIGLRWMNRRQRT